MDMMLTTEPQRMTLRARLAVTVALFKMRVPVPRIWLRAVWSRGATASQTPADQLPVTLTITSGDGNIEITFVIRKKAKP